MLICLFIFFIIYSKINIGRCDMEKIYLKYNDNRPCVECDYGFAKGILLLGFLYPYKKGEFLGCQTNDSINKKQRYI